MPKVSVVIAAWNAAATLERCVTSILNQQDMLSEDIEIVIVDDCSTDNTWTLIKDLRTRHGTNIIPVQTPANGGPSVARNLGFAAATGDWLAVVDGDDTIEPARLAKMLAHAQTEHSDICFDNIYMRHAQRPDVVDSILVQTEMARKLASNWTLDLYASLNKPYESKVLLGFLKPLFKKSFLHKNQLTYKHELRNSEDFILIVECLIKGANISFLDEPLYNYFIYENSLSGKFNRQAHRQLMACEHDLIEQYSSAISAKDQSALKLHLHSLQLAEETNDLFEHIRERQLSLLAVNIWNYRRHFLTHALRIYVSIVRRALNKQGRGK